MTPSVQMPDRGCAFAQYGLPTKWFDVYGGQLFLQVLLSELSFFVLHIMCTEVPIWENANEDSMAVTKRPCTDLVQEFWLMDSVEMVWANF